MARRVCPTMMASTAAVQTALLVTKLRIYNVTTCTCITIIMEDAAYNLSKVQCMYVMFCNYASLLVCSRVSWTSGLLYCMIYMYMYM